ncbi:SPOSA6832_00241 [Sporobolomyces salmonicolor]|uniref:SPOSA6832_00241-mRNA-1:cds n=1 Tax=Sporidiobolus salmonicolor TaxID=5005 RepID=A0A0D6EFQ3_SPOSA|nr:SPOSA6832_00241 [Sporobolomyces salmonicolor]
MAAQTDFSLTTALSCAPSIGDSPSFSLLPRHLRRLRTAHERLARELPDCWCSSAAFPSDEKLVEELERAVGAAGKEGKKGSLRVRLNIDPPGQPHSDSWLGTVDRTWPLSDPIRLVLDDRPTEYDDPFLRYKTTKRAKYDDARARQGAHDRVFLLIFADLVDSASVTGATLQPSSSRSDPPFDVLLFNPRQELTETTIANAAFRFSPTKPFITPRADCGLLEGVQRAELLEKGEVVEGVVTVEEVRKAAEVRLFRARLLRIQELIHASAFQAGTLEIICFNGVRGVYKACIAPSN